jgi:hypothetical protein
MTPTAPLQFGTQIILYAPRGTIMATRKEAIELARASSDPCVVVEGYNKEDPDKERPGAHITIYYDKDLGRAPAEDKSMGIKVLYRQA